MTNEGFKKVGVFCVKHSQMQSDEGRDRADKNGKGK